MISLNPSTPGASSFGAGPSTGMATGRTANFGYGSLAGEGNRPGPRGPMMMGPKSVAAPFQGVPDQPVGIQPAAAGTSQKQGGGGGGGGLIGRGMSFLKGLGEGGGAAEGAAGAGEAAAGAGAIEELAPLALLAA